MADDAGKSPAPADEPKAAQAAPMLVNAQYVKDLSFENPRSPASFAEARDGAPTVDIAVDLQRRQLQEKVYEVVLFLRGEARNDKGVLFLAEVHYAGLFTLGDVPPEAIDPLLAVAAPQLLFPYARAVISECVRDGGFAPLLVNPIDFGAMLRQRSQRAASGANGGASEESEPAPASD